MFFTALRRLGCVLAPATALTFAALATGPTVAQGEAATFAVTKTADTADGCVTPTARCAKRSSPPMPQPTKTR